MKRGFKRCDLNITAEKLIAVLLAVLLGVVFFLMIWRIANASANT